jgi:spoIIIJ-associated protein
MDKEKIVSRIRELVEKLKVSVDEIKITEAAGHTLFTIKTKDSGVLIGSGGETLHSLNHIVKKMFEHEASEESFRFVVDVNGYHLKHIKMLEAQATMLSERARTFKYDIEMSPMSPYDRLIVHSALTDVPDIETESQGEGRLRHIVIRYKVNTEAETAPPSLKEEPPR